MRREIDVANPLSVGQRVRLWTWAGTTDDGAMVTKTVEGPITRMAECDTGILMWVRDDRGCTHGAHLQRRFVSAGRVDGVVMAGADYRVTIVQAAPQQQRLPMLAQQIDSAQHDGYPDRRA